MKRNVLPLSLFCVLLASTIALGDPGDDFYEANISLTHAIRQEKEGNFMAALENSKKAMRLFHALQTSSPEWNPGWVADKLDIATRLQTRVKPLAQKMPPPKKSDYSLKPGEDRDFTMQRAYQAHARGKTVVRPVSPAPPAKASKPGRTVAPAPAPTPTPAPAPARQAEVRVAKPTISNPPPAPVKTAPVKTTPPRERIPTPGRSGLFRIGG